MFETTPGGSAPPPIPATIAEARPGLTPPARFEARDPTAELGRPLASDPATADIAPKISVVLASLDYDFPFKPQSSYI